VALYPLPLASHLVSQHHQRAHPQRFLVKSILLINGLHQSQTKLFICPVGSFSRYVNVWMFVPFWVKMVDWLRCQAKVYWRVFVSWGMHQTMNGEVPLSGSHCTEFSTTYATRPIVMIELCCCGPKLLYGLQVFTTHDPLPTLPLSHWFPTLEVDQIAEAGHSISTYHYSATGLESRFLHFLCFLSVSPKLQVPELWNLPELWRLYPLTHTYL